MADDNKILLTVEVDASDVEAKVGQATEQVISAKTERADRDRQRYTARRERILKRRRTRQRRFEQAKQGEISKEQDKAARISEREIRQKEAQDRKAQKEQERISIRDQKSAEKLAEKERREKEKADAEKAKATQKSIDNMHATLKRMAFGVLLSSQLQIRSGTIIQSTLATMADALDKIAMAGLIAGGPAGIVSAGIAKLTSVFTEGFSKLMDYGRGAAQGAARFSPIAMAALARRNVAEIQSEIALSRNLGHAAARTFRAEESLFRDPNRLKAIEDMRRLGMVATREGIETERTMFREAAKAMTPETMRSAQDAMRKAAGLGGQAFTAAMQSGAPDALVGIGSAILGVVQDIFGAITGKDPETGGQLSPLERLGFRRAPSDWTFWETFKNNLGFGPPEGKTSKTGTGGIWSQKRDQDAPSLIPSEYEQEWRSQGTMPVNPQSGSYMALP